MKKEESDALIKFLRDLIEDSQDLHTRVFWKPKTVVVWDVSLIADFRKREFKDHNMLTRRRTALSRILHYPISIEMILLNAATWGALHSKQSAHMRRHLLIRVLPRS